MEKPRCSLRVASLLSQRQTVLYAMTTDLLRLSFEDHSVLTHSAVSTGRNSTLSLLDAGSTYQVGSYLVEDVLGPTSCSVLLPDSFFVALVNVVQDVLGDGTGACKLDDEVGR